MGINVDHRSFVIERELPGSPAHAFRFWSNHQLKRCWNSCHPDWTIIEDRFDFRVDGHESMIWRRPDGTEQVMLAHFLEIHPRQRIVYAYTMRTTGAPISSSLVTGVRRPGRQNHDDLDRTSCLRQRDGRRCPGEGTGAGFARLQEAMMDFEEDTSS